MTAQEMLDQAIIELGNLKDGSIFIVRDLFKGYLWNRQDRSERLTLGTLFMNFARLVSDIEVLTKNSSGQQEYKMLKSGAFRTKNYFAKGGTVRLEKVHTGMLFASIGTSGLDLWEEMISSEAEVERFASILNQSRVMPKEESK